MEGLPRLPMLAVDMKYSATGSLPNEFSSRIKEYILVHYGDDPSRFETALTEMDNLRQSMTRLIPDVETICVAKRYFAQLTMMKSRFPMEMGDPLQIPFAWLDRGLEMPSPVVFEDVNYELSCTLLNIGALHAAIAVDESRSTPDSIKNAFMHFQCAAWPFQMIRDKMINSYSSIDFEPAMLNLLVNLMLAQAQECILEKSLMDHRKDLVIAKIALHLHRVYQQCQQHLESSGLVDLLYSSKYKEYVRTCKIKCEIYGAIYALHMGQHCDMLKRMGHRLSWYVVAVEHVKTASKLIDKDKRETMRQAMLFLSDVVLAKEANARKENDFIYHERTPSFDELDKVEGVVLVKAIGFDPTDRSIAGDDLFASLLPTNVVRSLSLYSEEKAKWKRSLLEQIVVKDTQLTEFLSALKLDEINLNESVDQLRLPDMLLERSAAFNAQPDAFPELIEKLSRVGECSIDADHKLNDLTDRLAKIKSTDLKADAGFMAVNKEMDRLNETHIRARRSNTELQKAIAAHSENLKLLALPLSQLNRRITGPAIKPSETAEGALLKRILDKVDEMRVQRSTLIDSLTKDLDADDITQKCLATKHEDNTDLFVEELKKHSKTVEMIQKNLLAQDNILAALTEANANFAECRKQLNNLNASRNEQMITLVGAFDVFADVRVKADLGLQFYSQLFDRVRSLDETVEAIEMAYENERKHQEEQERVKLENKAKEAQMERESLPDLSIVPSADVDKEQRRRPRLADYMDFYRSKMLPGMENLNGIPQSSDSESSEFAHFQPGSNVAHSREIDRIAVHPREMGRIASFSSASPQSTNFAPTNTAATEMAFSSFNSPSHSDIRPLPYPYPYPSPMHSMVYPSAVNSPMTERIRTASIAPSSPSPSPLRHPTPFPTTMPSHFSSTIPVQPVGAMSTLIVKGMYPPPSSSPCHLPSTVPAKGMYPPPSSSPCHLPSTIPAHSPSNSTVNSFPCDNRVAMPQWTNANQRLSSDNFSSPTVSSPYQSNRFDTRHPDTMNLSHSNNYYTPPHPSTPMTNPRNPSPMVLSPWHQSLNGPSPNMNPVSLTGPSPNMNPVSLNGPSPNMNPISLTGPSPNMNPGGGWIESTRPFQSNTVMYEQPSTQNRDVMSMAVDCSLPPPLLPAVSVPVSKEVVNEIVSSTENVVLSMLAPIQSMASSPIPSSRPAAAVLPIVQQQSITSREARNCAPIEPMAMAMGTETIGTPNISTVTNEDNPLSDVMNANTFHLGQTDENRVQRRQMKEEFRRHGTKASLTPPTDTSDPLNGIDSHFFVKDK